MYQVGSRVGFASSVLVFCWACWVVSCRLIVGGWVFWFCRLNIMGGISRVLLAASAISRLRVGVLIFLAVLGVRVIFCLDIFSFA